MKRKREIDVERNENIIHFTNYSALIMKQRHWDTNDNVIKKKVPLENNHKGSASCTPQFEDEFIA